MNELASFGPNSLTGDNDDQIRGQSIAEVAGDGVGVDVCVGKGSMWM